LDWAFAYAAVSQADFTAGQRAFGTVRPADRPAAD